jgi:hypothetical protein
MLPFRHLLVLSLLMRASPGVGQTTANTGARPITPDGVRRASALVDSGWCQETSN